MYQIDYGNMCIGSDRRFGRIVKNARFKGDVSLVCFLVEKYILILNFSLASRSSQLGEVHGKEIKHDIHQE